MSERRDVPAARRPGRAAGPGGAAGGAPAAAQGQGQGPAPVRAPGVSLPKGGGAVGGIGEKFSANPVNGTGSLTVPLALSPGRSGFGPGLELRYDSGAGNGIFGLGWQLGLPAIARRTDKGLPRYLDDPTVGSDESDVFVLAGGEDLVPADGGRSRVRTYGHDYDVQRYRPRIDGLGMLIERWTAAADRTDVFWRTIDRDNVTSWYGRTPESRVVDPADPGRAFQWSICERHDDKGNAAEYGYAREDARGVDWSQPNEANRTPADLTAITYLKRVRYGNTRPFLPTMGAEAPTPAGWPTADLVPDQAWMFEVVLDYGDHTAETGTDGTDAPVPTPDRPWTVRADPFSAHRAGFEVRTLRLCRRVLMFHHFPDDPAVGADCLVRSTDLGYREPTRPDDPGQPGYTVLAEVVHRSYRRRRTAAGTTTGYDTRQHPPLTFAYSEPRIDPTVRTLPPESLAELPAGIHGGGSGPGHRWVDLDGEGLSGVLAEEGGAWWYTPNRGDGRFGPQRRVAELPAMADLAGGDQQLVDLTGGGTLALVDLAPPNPGFHRRQPDGDPSGNGLSDNGNGNGRDHEWTGFTPFRQVPNVDADDPQLRFVDLTGDGRGDVLLTEDEVVTWYPSRGEEGYGEARTTPGGPRLVFADGTETVFLADMSGDGLTDLVRVRNHEVSVWPNQGYGKFGPKVALANTKGFDRDDLFDPRRVRLADVDGSGPADVLYLASDGARVYFNRSGNGLSDPAAVPLPLPARTQAGSAEIAGVQVADLLGDGTACLVATSPLPADAGTGRQVRYVALMADGKPHLLTGVDNNLGGTTEIEYAPSTRFFLQDQRDGSPWVTRLPFPVHCVSRVTRRDKWRGTAFSSTYSYHHGFYDGDERELRGFGRVEQVDVEDFGTFAAGNPDSPFVTPDRSLYQPPVKTVTWYDVGAARERDRLAARYAREAFPARHRLDGFAEKAPDPADAGALAGQDLADDEWREAARARKGRVLRQEAYELDVDDLAGPAHRQRPVRLWSVATHDHRVERLQPRGSNRHAVFLATEREALTYQHDLPLPAPGAGGTAAATVTPDPRIEHTLNLRHDDLGNVLQAVTVGYGRLRPGLPAGVPATIPHPERIVAAQAELHTTYTEVRHTGDVVVRGPAATGTTPPGTTPAVRHHRPRLVAETRTYELTGLTVPASGYLDVAGLRRHALCEDGRYPPTPGAPGQPPDPVAAVAYHEQPPAIGVGRRLVQHAVSLYRRDEDGVARPDAAHPRGTHGPRGTKHEDHTLALTRGLLDAVFDAGASGSGSSSGSGEDLLARPLRPGGPPVGDLLDDPATSGYVPGTALDPAWTGQHWTASGRAGFTRPAADTFYVPEAFTDPFGHTTTQRHDARNLFVEASTDPLGNVTRVASFDRRVLAAREVVDPNGNHSEAAFDILGRVVATATKGKAATPAGGGTGDNLDGLTDDLLDPDEAEVQAFCTSTTFDEATARTWLDDATTRFVQHFGERRDPVTGAVTWADRMAGACAVHRSHHVTGRAGATAGATAELDVALECSDGSGTVLMTKARAEPEQPGGPDRWVVHGRTVVNNKGKPVKQYEPAFTDDFGAQLPPAEGVTPVMAYDAADRLVRTDHPDGTVERVEPTPWVVRTFDRNDTVLESAWYTTRDQLDPAQPLPRDLAGVVTADPDQRAGWLAARHAGTPALSLLDSRGRPVVEVVHDRVEDPAGPHTYDGRTWRDVHHAAHTRVDAEGRTLWVRDARDVLAVQHLVPPRPTTASDDTVPAGTVPGYDIAGNLLFQHGADSGSRWTLPDAAGEPLLTWDVNDRPPPPGTGSGPRPRERRLSLIRKDALRRPVEQWLRIDDADPVLIEAADHADTATLAAAGTAALDDARARNLIGQRVRHYDTGGLATIERLDADGAVEEVGRALVADPTAELMDWDVADRATLLAETHHRITEHDARGRPTTVYEWHRDRPGQPGRSDRVAVRVPRYNARGLVAAEDLHVRATKQTAADGTRTFSPDTTSGAGRNPAAIAGVTWNAKGQKLVVELGNGTTTEHTYDPATSRLVHLATSRATSTTQPTAVQDLRFTYDPAGNVTHLHDGAQDTIWFANQQVEPSRDFAYDALDRLTEAEGRESAAATGAPPHPAGPWPRGAMPSNDATRRFTERYRYDAVGNLLQVRHEASGGNWTRNHEVSADGNRLVRTWFGTATWDATPGAQRTEHRHDLHGNLLNLASTAPALDLRWDRRDMIATVDLVGGGTAHLQHDLDGERTRKRLDRGGTVEERIALGGYERYRRWVGTTLVEEVETTHLELGDQRVLLVDDVLLSDDAATDDRTVLRYQHADHLGTVGTELDGDARVIGHEEHHPYGTPAYRRSDAAVAAPPRRYRYTGAERDDETGLDHHGARYYAPGLGRWASCDPDGLADGPNVYAYCRGNPVRRTDPSGRASDDKAKPAPPPAAPPPAPTQAVPKTRDYLGVPAAVANELIEGMVWNKWFGPGGGNQAVVINGLRGKIVDRLAGNNLGLYQRLVDKRIGDRIIQIKSFLRERNEVQGLINQVRSATADAAEWIRELPRAQRLRRLLPQAQIVLPSWARHTLDQVAKTALNGAGAARQAWRSLPRFALPPIVTRGVPGLVGSAARVLQRVAVPLLALGLGSAIHRGDTVGVIDNLSGLVPAGLGAFSRFAASRAAPAALGSLAPGAARFGHVAAAFAAGWTVGRLVDEHLLSEQTRNDIGGTLNQIVNEGGWRDTANLRNPFGLRTLYQSITGP